MYRHSWRARDRASRDHVPGLEENFGTTRDDRVTGVRTSGGGPDTLADVDPAIGSTSLMKFAARNILILGLVVGGAQAAAGCRTASMLPGETLNLGADTLLVGGNQWRGRTTGDHEVTQAQFASRCDRGHAPSATRGQSAGGLTPSGPVRLLVRGEQQPSQRGHRERNRHRSHGGHWRGHPHSPHGWRGHPHPHHGWRGPRSGPRWHRRPHWGPPPGVFWHRNGWRGWHWHWPFAHRHRHPHPHGRHR